MNCGSCKREILPDVYFCQWCGRYVAAPRVGTKAGLFARWIALVLDPLIALLIRLVPTVILVAVVGESLALLVVFLGAILYVVWWVRELRQGRTPGKRLLGLRVVAENTGDAPGLGRMFVREIPGRFVSGLIFGLGYLWAILDKNAQAWHDKIARTLVVKVGG